ncbi:hypothetical protein ACRRTK_008146 [Alexandromys fortis]
MGGVCCSRLLAKPLPAVGFGAEEGPLGRAIRGLGQDLTLGSGPRSILRHRPPAPGRLTDTAGPGTLGKAPGSRWAKRSSSGGRLGLLGCPASRSGSGDFCPGSRRLRSLRSPQRPSPPPEAAYSNESRASRAVSPSPFPIATATKWRTREKRPGTSPLVQRTPSAHARSRALPHRGGPPVDVSRGSQSGVRSRGSRREPLVLAPAFGEEAEEAVGQVLPGPQSSSRATAAAALGPPALGKKTTGAEKEQRFGNLFLGTKPSALAGCLAREAWPSGDCELEGPGKSGGSGKAWPRVR